MKKRITSVICVLLALVMVLQLTGAVKPLTVNAAKSTATLKSEIKDLKSDKAEIDEKIAAIRGDLKENLENMEDIVAQKNLIDQEVFLLYSQLTNIEEQIAAYSALIADKQDQLDQAQEHLTQLQIQNKERIRAMEKNGGLSYWSVIFKANSFVDLLDRLRMVQEIAEADQRRLEEMSAAAEVVAQAKVSLEEEKEGLEQTRAELESAQVELDAKRAEADALLAELVAKGEEYEALVEAAEEEAGKLAQEILEKEAEVEAIEEEERRRREEAARKEAERLQQLLQQQQQQNGGSGNSSAGGFAGDSNYVNGLTWLVPISYTEFSSPYGWRIHPIYGTWKFHYGVDLSAPTGTPIVASRSGKVTTTSYDGSSGYHVYINHQDGFVTRYLHMTHYIVSPGDYVNAGQVIGYCGSTGASTGPHLHFSVYYNGVSMNPADFISI